MRWSIFALVPLTLAQLVYDNTTAQVAELTSGFLLEWDWLPGAISFTLNLGTPIYGSFSWVGIGLQTSASTYMKGADIYTLVWVNGNFYLTDRSAVGNTMPVEDISQGGTNDLTLLDFVDDGHNVTVSFKRDLVTGDKDVVITNNTAYTVLYAWGTANGEMLTYHTPTQRGTKLVNFTISPSLLSNAISLLALTSWMILLG